LAFLWSAKNLAKPMSVGGWFNTDSINNSSFLVSKYSSTLNYRSFFLQMTGGAILFSVQYDTSDSIILYSSSTLAVSTWYHIIAIYDQSTKTMQIYIDGKLAGERYNEANLTTRNNTADSKFTVGGFYSAGTCAAPFDGLIADVFYRKSVLTQQQILNLYKSGSGKFVTKDFRGNLFLYESSPTLSLVEKDSIAWLLFNNPDPRIYMSNYRVNHGMTNLAPPNAFLSLQESAAVGGGANITGFTDADWDGFAMAISAINGYPTPSNATMLFSASKKNGVTHQALGATEKTFQWKNYSTEQMTILGNGNVGIGTATPGAKLHSYASSGINYIWTESASLANGESTNISAIGLKNSGSSRVTTIGTTYNNGSTSNEACGYIQLPASDGINNYMWSSDADELYFSVTGSNIGTTTGNKISYTSDERLKRNKIPTKYGLKEVLQLNPINYDLHDRKEVGLGAQSVQKIIPEAVYGTGDKFEIDGKIYENKLNLEYNQIVAVLVKGMQEQQAIIEQLKQRIEALENN
jgi:hypothetical protein